jgi:CRP/FNR family transcriptional regulator/CRP/FNR family cyclic AMP-dependent transcriptional regulator
MTMGQGQAFFGAIVADGEARGADGNRGFAGVWSNVLASVPLFAGLPNRHLRSIAALAERAPIPRYTTIVDPARNTEAFYVILDGEADVSTADGTHIKLRAGQFFGEMALLNDDPRTATVTAATDMLTMRISRIRFHQLLDSEPTIALRVMQELASRVRRIEATHQSPTTP